jgi:hypothetical protein
MRMQLREQFLHIVQEHQRTRTRREERRRKKVVGQDPLDDGRKNPKGLFFVGVDQEERRGDEVHPLTVAHGRVASVSRNSAR